MKRTPWQDRIVLVAGLWLFASPFALGTASLSHPATVAAYVCATMLVSSAAESSGVPDPVQEAIIFIVGAGLAATPWMLGYEEDDALAANAVAAGAVVCACAVAGLVRRRLAERDALRPRATPAFPHEGQTS